MDFKSFNITTNPIYLSSVIILAGMMGIIIVHSTGISESWSFKIAASSILFYAVSSVIFALKQVKFKNYLIKAGLGMILLQSLLILAAWYFSENAAEHFKLYTSIFSCLFVFFLMLAGLIVIMKGVLEWVSGGNGHRFFK